MTRTKIILVVVLAACIVLFMFVWFHNQPKPMPSFSILNFDCSEIPSTYGHDIDYQIVFTVKNEGDGKASYIEGIMEFGNNQNRTWRLIPDDRVLEPGAEYKSVVIWLDEKPSDLIVDITVECEEGVKQHFTRFLPP